jgi:hypothetical protein
MTIGLKHWITLILIMAYWLPLRAQMPKMLITEINRQWKISNPEFEAIPYYDAYTQPMGAMYNIKQNNTMVGKVYIGRINSCRQGGCSVNNGPNPKKNSEYFDAFILYNNNNSIALVRIYNYAASHGYGVCNKGWLKQFIGFDATKNLVAGKDIDTISGATISVNALTNEVNYITGLLNPTSRDNK